MAHISEKNNLINLAIGLVLLLLIGALMEYIPGDAGPRVVQAATVALLLVNTWSMKGNQSRLAVNIFFVLMVLLLVVGGARTR